jgi:hypothetical protein
MACKAHTYMLRGDSAAPQEKGRLLLRHNITSRTLMGALDFFGLESSSGCCKREDRITGLVHITEDVGSFQMDSNRIWAIIVALDDEGRKHDYIA